MLILIGSASAVTYTEITAVKTLGSQNSYTLAPGAWTALATGSNVNYIVANTGYDYIVGVNVTAVGVSPKLNVKAGNNPPAFRSGLGDKAYSLTNGTVMWIGPLQSARFLNSTGYYQFTTTNVTTGTIMVLKVVRY